MSIAYHEPDLVLISNELEFSLHNIDASRLVGNGLPLVHEVNPRDVVELNVSLAGDVEELNENLTRYIRQLVNQAEALEGNIYGGSSLLKDVSDVEPIRYRTTSLSESCARGFLDITSQQIVLGPSSEEFGFQLYNFFIRAAPALLALTASSPFVFRNGRLRDAKAHSRRVRQYEHICGRFPNSMWRDAPSLSSLDEYDARMGSVSEEVLRYLSEGKLDANWDELTRHRWRDGRPYAYFPFSKLDPHQVYWTVRIRPDHKTDNCPFSVEIRTPDMPTTTERMRMLNSLVSGIAYFMADTKPIYHPYVFSTGGFGELSGAASHGLGAVVNSVPLRKEALKLIRYAGMGLEGRGYRNALEDINLAGWIVDTDATDSNLIRSHEPKTPDRLRSYLIGRLRDGE